VQLALCSCECVSRLRRRRALDSSCREWKASPRVVAARRKVLGVLNGGNRAPRVLVAGATHHFQRARLLPFPVASEDHQHLRCASCATAGAGRTGAARLPISMHASAVATPLRAAAVAHTPAYIERADTAAPGGSSVPRIRVGDFSSRSRKLETSFAAAGGTSPRKGRLLAQVKQLCFAAWRRRDVSADSLESYNG
jgi:hypothetical protein